ncbi:hypothetical protein DFH29DRAFT_882216 [Suillus ampliporus]|nr:hypothetical protein DFH29DRAFT_882216 [Suillus ampliporus]
MGSVLPVILVTLVITLALTSPWWRTKLPAFTSPFCAFFVFCQGADEEEEEEEADIVDVELQFARPGVPPLCNATTRSCASRPVPDADTDSFWCRDDDEPSWSIDGASAVDGTGPSHPSGGCCPTARVPPLTAESTT